MDQQTLDTKHAVFWNERCGADCVYLLGMTEITPETFRGLAVASLALYPYLQGYVPSQPLQDPEACFDYVYTIGCVHHTGNLP